MKQALAFTLAALGCGGGDTNHTAIDAAGADAAQLDAEAIDAALTTVSVSLGSGDANGLFWNATTQTLYFTDNNAITVDKYSDADGVQVVAPLPSDPAGESFGGVLQLADDNILTTDFGFGSDGTIDELVAGSGSGVALTGLDPTRRRTGLASDGSGNLYDCYTGSNGVGGASRLTISGGAATEVEIAGSNNAAPFEALVGIVATATAIYVTDQTAGAIYAVDPATGTVSTFATGLAAAGLLMVLPDGNLLTGGSADITLITPGGVVSTLPVGPFDDVRGLAYDLVNHRLFIADHSTTAGSDFLRIQPLAE